MDVFVALCEKGRSVLAPGSLGTNIGLPLQKIFWHEMTQLSESGGFGTRALQTSANLLLSWRMIPEEKMRSIFE